ncbi:hypothetical protein AVEN_84070-1 [Araneus ventricosus]|uniref:Uncharacterized protein n=1 Tax=Araneus ventricosus TaxID=182803 RepID=A0A4Y2JS87_ARAVE|nr:hypothetical protein AVEN_242766-1 [Araneus ventricosus]GBM93281.1 hypothetical protein AVEN_152279-1 [Araneus ventricosus]GBM93330.1 hypothetical protein AVEN_98844-1 [Araneus ventricosus]GBM93385.1 hypothetical protein AVEN_84070-1 [Araneus ventricosus]
MLASVEDNSLHHHHQNNENLFSVYLQLRVAFSLRYGASLNCFHQSADSAPAVLVEFSDSEGLRNRLNNCKRTPKMLMKFERTGSLSVYPGIGIKCVSAVVADEWRNIELQTCKPAPVFEPSSPPMLIIFLTSTTWE